jgi:Mn-dependent DtxR family transcriptional regulator
LFIFHNTASRLCHPAYEAIAAAAGCDRSTVAAAINMLESAGVLTWANRIVRVREDGRWRVLRTSNCYRFLDPKAPAAWPEGLPPISAQK